MITKEEFEKAVECCTGFIASCENCPLSEKDFKCGVYLAEYLKENEPAPEATGTSSEVSKDTDNIHINVALDDYPNEFLTGYIEAFKDNIRRLRGGHSD